MQIVIFSTLFLLSLILIWVQLRIGYLENKVQELNLIVYELKVRVKKTHISADECDKVNMEILRKW